MKATTEITTRELKQLWEDAVTYSRIKMEYVRKGSNGRPEPLGNNADYWAHMVQMSPWNEIDGFEVICKNRPDRVITISLQLLAAIDERARKKYQHVLESL